MSFSTQSSLNRSYFQYDVLAAGRIRIFKLDLNAEDEPLSGSLLTTYHLWNGLDVSSQYWKSQYNEDTQEILKILTGEEVYDTLSYTWGDQTQTHPLRLSRIGSKIGADDQPRTNFEPYRAGTIQIGNNLKALLIQLRRKKHRRFLWIDAICINQANDVEKKMQIPMMRDIYEYAGHGYIWLGAASQAEVEELETLPHLTEQLEVAVANSVTLSPGRDETFLAANLPAPHETVWKTLRTVMKNPYWSRLWTLQEAVVSEQTGRTGGKSRLYNFPPTEVFYGEATVPLRVFNSFCIAATALDLRAWIITGELYSKPHSYYGFDGIDEIRTCRYSWGTDFWGVSLSALLLGTRRRRATIASDIIYGILAMVDHTTQKFLLPTSETNISTRDLFVRFAKHYIRNELKENLLNHIATEQRMEGLPSWCPNFASPPKTLSLGSRWSSGRPPSDVDPLSYQMYTAGYKHEGKWKIPKSRVRVLKSIANILSGKHQNDNIYNTNDSRRMTFLTDSDYLLVSGIHVDIVTATVKCNSGAESENFLSYDNVLLTEQWDMECLKLSLQHLSRDMPVHGFEVYARTIAANRLTIEASRDQSILFDQFDKVDFVDRYRQFRDVMENIRETKGDMSIEAVAREARQYTEVVSRTTCRRKFFATEGGRIGLGPADTEVGDAVCVLFYCPTPYILRHNPTGRSQLVGESYVHGLMYGEALDMIGRGDLDETKWVLE